MPFLQYQGRLAQRSDSQQRREQILNATLQIIVEEGVREVRHRSVATKAQVPLSATTYYFKDINTLMHDAFIFFVRQQMRDLEQLNRSALQTLHHFQQHQDKNRFKQELFSFLFSHIQNQTTNHESRILEASFRQQALRDRSLASALYQIQRVMLDAIESFFMAFRPADKSCTAKAQIVLGTLQHLEFQHLLGTEGGYMPEQLERVIETLLSSTLLD